MSRVAVFNIVTTAVGDGVFVYGSYAGDNPVGDRFAVITWHEESPAFGAVGSETVDVWLYDKDRDFTWINTTLDTIRDAMIAAVHVPGDGDILTKARWLGYGPDFFDPDYRKVARNATFETVTRPSSGG